MKASFKLNDKDFQRTLRRYSKVSSMKPGEIVKKRALRICIKLMQAYKRTAPSREEIEGKAKSLDYRLAIRPSIARSKGSRANKVKRELAARKRSVTFTAMGWIFAGKQAGLGLKAKVLKKFKRKVRSIGKSRLSGRRPFVILWNTLPGAAVIEATHKIISKTMNREAKDMQQYIERKTMPRHAKKSGF